MSDDLRNRIIDAINNEMQWESPELTENLANAIIKKLGLSSQTLYKDKEMSNPRVTRWVTRWEIASNGR